MKSALPMALLFSWTLAHARPLAVEHKEAPTPYTYNGVTFASYVKDNFQILSKRKKENRQVAFQENYNRLPADVAALLPNQNPQPGAPNNQNGGQQQPSGSLWNDNKVFGKSAFDSNSGNFNNNGNVFNPNGTPNNMGNNGGNNNYSPPPPPPPAPAAVPSDNGVQPPSTDKVGQ